MHDRSPYAFGHFTPDRPLRWLEPAWEPALDTCTRRGGERVIPEISESRERRGLYCTA